MRAKSFAFLVLLPSLVLGMLGPPVSGESPISRALANEGDDDDDGGRDDDGDDRDDDDDGGDDEGLTFKVPGDFPTIASAVAAAPDGSRIKIAPGIYAEQLLIEDKQLRITGSVDGRTVLVSPSDRDAGILTYGSGGGGKLKNLSFTGGAYAIGSDRNGRELPSAVDVRDVSISRGYRGIYGAFSDLTLKNVLVSDTLWTGISLTHVDYLHKLIGVEVEGAGGAGLYLDNTGGDVSIAGHFHHNDYAGIQVHGGMAAFFLTAADHNGLFGIILFDVQAGMGLSLLEDQINAPPLYGDPPGPNECEGVGLSLLDGSSVTVAGTRFEDNCLGFTSVPGTSATLTQNVFSSTTGLDEAIFVDGNVTFGDGNHCGYNMGSANEFEVSCNEFFLGTPQAPPPLGEDALE